MSRDLHILILEDRTADAELVAREVRAEGISCTTERVFNEEGFLREMRTHTPDLVLADYALPSYDGISALKFVRAEFPEVPFIFVSGTLGEERAIDALHNGAMDYVMKQRIGRLGPAVRRALREVEQIRERRRSEAALRDAEALYHSLVEHLPQCVYRKDLQGRFTYANELFCALLGRPLAEVLGRTCFDFYPADLAGRYRRDDEQVMQSGEILRSVEESHLPGKTKTVVQIIKSPARSATGEIIGVQGIYTDITSQLELEEKFLRAQRLESIGSLSSGIAHDLNNILTPILICAPMLRAGLSEDERENLVSTVEESARRAVSVVKQLLTIGRGQEGRKVPVQIGHLVREMMKIARETFPRTIRTEENIAPNAWPVIGDPTQLHQVILNLCINARDAMPAGGCLAISAANVEIDDHFVAMHADAHAGSFVRLRVSDTGTGIPEAAREHIFDPFFTTKDHDHGTGLGLTTVLGIVKSHGGFITFTSVSDGGTTFEIHLPAQPDGGELSEVERAEPAAPMGHGETILVVDDEEAVREATRMTLERRGYSVLAAADGIEALAHFHVRSHDIRAVVTDLRMPMMDGLTLCRIVRRLDRTLPIIVSTGETAGSEDGPTSSVLRELEVVDVLRKPYNAETLLSGVHRVLAVAASAPPRAVAVEAVSAIRRPFLAP